MNNYALEYARNRFFDLFSTYGFECVEKIQYPERRDSICVLESSNSLMSIRIVSDRGACSLNVADKSKLNTPKAIFKGDNSRHWHGPDSIYFVLHGPFDMDADLRIDPGDNTSRKSVSNQREAFILEHFQELLDMFTHRHIDETISKLRHADQLLLEAEDRWIAEVQENLRAYDNGE